MANEPEGTVDAPVTEKVVADAETPVEKTEEQPRPAIEMDAEPAEITESVPTAPVAEAAPPEPVKVEGAEPVAVRPAEAAPTEPVVVAPLASDGAVELHLVGRTDVGLIREHNEDNFTLVRLDDDARDPAVLLHHTLETRGTLLVVCDGMGGAAAGEIASAMAVATLPEVMRSDAPIPAPSSITEDEATTVARKLRHAAEEANRRIFVEQQNNPARSGMGTTMTAALLHGGDAIIAQVGDSRCYVYRQGTLTQVTRDQSLVNQLLETGQITAEQAKYFEHSNVILQALGVQEDVEVQLSRVSLRQGDRIMLCSDGLVGVITDEEIAAVVGAIDDPAEAARLLIELANGAGGPDNITVVVGHLSGGALPAPRPEDTITYSTWFIDPPPPPEAPIQSALTTAPQRAVSTPPEGALAVSDLPRPSVTAWELFSMSLIVGIVAGAVMLGSSLYHRGVPCEVRATRAGMTVLADGRDSGVRTVEGTTSLRLRPGHHSVALAGANNVAAGQFALLGPHQDLEVAAGQACVVSFDDPTAATGEPGRGP